MAAAVGRVGFYGVVLNARAGDAVFLATRIVEDGPVVPGRMSFGGNSRRTTAFGGRVTSMEANLGGC